MVLLRVMIAAQDDWLASVKMLSLYNMQGWLFKRPRNWLCRESQGSINVDPSLAGNSARLIHTSKLSDLNNASSISAEAARWSCNLSASQPQIAALLVLHLCLRSQ